MKDDTTIRSMKNVHLGELEQEIMEIAWKNSACTVRDILTELQKHRKIAYTTVATVLHRLCGKGMLSKKKASMGDVYEPNVSKDAFTKRIANSFLKNFIGSYGDDAIASFADTVDKLPKEKRKYFLDLLNDHDKSK